MLQSRNVNKNYVVLTIVTIFAIMFLSFILIYYMAKERDIEFVKENTQKSVIHLYNEVSFQMLAKQLQFNSKTILNSYKKNEKIQAIKNRNREKIKELFGSYYKNLKEQIKGFEIMHFYDQNGISILRMHNLKKYGDDLKKFRHCVRSIVKKQEICSFFEVGIQGLAYRYTVPVYDEKDQLIGFFELGVKPLMILQKIKKIFGFEGYVFIENRYIPKGIIESTVKINKKYSVCKMCPQRDEFLNKLYTMDLDSNIYFETTKKSYNIIKKEIYDAQENRIGYIVFFQDITILKEQIHTFLLESIVLFLIIIIITSYILHIYINSIFKRLNKARFLLDNVTDAVYVIDLINGNIIDVNERATLMLGFNRNELLRKNLLDIRKPMPGNKQLNWNEHINHLKLNHFITLRGMHIRKDASSFPVESNLSYVTHDNEEYMIAVARDITKTLQLEKKIAQETNKMKRLQDVISQSVLYTTSDLNGNITSVSKAFEKFSGYRASYLIGKNHSILKDPHTPVGFYTSMWGKLLHDKTFVGEIRTQTKDKQLQWVKLTINPIFDEEGNKVGYSSYRENITDKKKLEYISIHDSLTGIHNRAYFQQELQKKISAAVRYNHSFGFVMLDIDHFKSVNDTYGHAVGDKVLQTMAQALSTHIREDDIFARWGGEEFIIIANGATMESLQGLIEKLQKEIANISFAPVPSVTASFGLTLYKSGDTIETIQKRADDALYQAKEKGRDRYEMIF